MSFGALFDATKYIVGELVSGGMALSDLTPAPGSGPPQSVLDNGGVRIKFVGSAPVSKDAPLPSEMQEGSGSPPSEKDGEEGSEGDGDGEWRPKTWKAGVEVGQGLMWRRS